MFSGKSRSARRVAFRITRNSGLIRTAAAAVVATLASAVCFPAAARASTDVWTNDNGTGNSQWDTLSPNWSTGTYTNGDNVIFNDSAGLGNTNIILVGTLNPASINVADPTLDFSFTGTGSIGSANGAGLTKSGAGALTIDNSNPNTYTGATTVDAGTLVLNFNALATPTNLIDTGSGLAMNGGTLLQIGNSSTTTNQGFNGTLIGEGGSSIDSISATASNLFLGSLTRLQGATVDINAPSNGSITTSTANAYGSGASLMLGGYATVGGTSWATNAAGDIVALGPSGYTANVAGSNVNTDVTTSGTISGGNTTNSLRFNTASAISVNGGPEFLQSGGILMTPNVGNNSTTIGLGYGNLTSSNTENDLIIQQFDTQAPLNVDATIVNNAGPTALTKSGPGTVVLSFTNNYTGPTYINGGILNVGTITAGGTPSSIGGSSNAASNLVLNGGTLQIAAGNTSTDRLFTLGPNGGTIDSESSSLNFTSTNPIATLADVPTSLTLTGTGGGGISTWNQLDPQLADPDALGRYKLSVVKNGAGAWALDNPNSSYTGGTTVNAGVLKVLGAEVSPTTSSVGDGPVTVNSGATLGGSGFIAGNVTLNAGANLQPGDPNKLQINGNLTLNTGSQMTYTLNAAGILGPTGGSDATTTNSNLNLGMNIPLSINPGPNFGTGTYPFIQYSSLTNNSDNFSGWSANVQSVPASFVPGEFYNYSFSNNAIADQIDLNVTDSGGMTGPTLNSSTTSTTFINAPNSKINNTVISNPIIKVTAPNKNGNIGGPGGNGGSNQTFNFYLGQGGQNNAAKAFSFGWVPVAFQLTPGTPYFVAKGIQVGDPAQTGIPVSPNPPYTTNPPFNPAGTGEVSIGGNVVGAIYPAGTNPPSAAPDDWLPAYYLAPVIVVIDPPATPIPTYYGETYSNPANLTDIYLADQVNGEDMLPSQEDTDAAGADDQFDYQGSFLSLVQSDFPSITDLSQLTPQQWDDFDGSFGVDPVNDVAWAVDDAPNADYTVVGIGVPEPGTLSLLLIPTYALLTRRRRRV